jgi:RHS repeat-associated protein
LKTESQGGQKTSLLRGRRIGVYPGQYYDPATGLHYNYFRYYNPQTGRYITPDPIGMWGGINLFGYVRNPINAVDPWGLMGFTQAVAIIGSGSGTAAYLSAAAGAGAAAAAGVGIAAVGAGLIWYLATDEDIERMSVWEYELVSMTGPVYATKPKPKDCPTGTRSGDLPGKAKPSSTDVKDKGQGEGQIRDYGPDGRAKVDYDFGHDHGAGDPHAHDWDWSKKPPRQPGRKLKPGE